MYEVYQHQFSVEGGGRVRDQNEPIGEGSDRRGRLYSEEGLRERLIDLLLERRIPGVELKEDSIKESPIEYNSENE